MIPPKRRDVVNADTQRWSPPAGMSPYLPASTILNPLRRPPSPKRHIQAVAKSWPTAAWPCHPEFEVPVGAASVRRRVQPISLHDVVQPVGRSVSQPKLLSQFGEFRQLVEDLASRIIRMCG